MTFESYRMGLQQSPVLTLHHQPHPSFFHPPPIQPAENSLLFPAVLQQHGAQAPAPPAPPPPSILSPSGPTLVVAAAEPRAESSSSATSPLKTQRAPYGAGGEDDGFDMKFDNMQKFLEWRAEIEERDVVEFVKGDSHTSKAVPPRFKDHTKLVCARHSRSGRKKYVKKYPERQRRVPSRKIEEGCLASISYKTYFESEIVRVNYNPEHSHEIGMANLPFTKRGRKAGMVEKRKTPTSTPRIQQPALHDDASTPSDGSRADHAFGLDDTMSPRSLLDSTSTMSAAVSPHNLPSNNIPLPVPQPPHMITSSQAASPSHSLSTPHSMSQPTHLPNVHSQPHSQPQHTGFGQARPIAPTIVLPNSQRQHNLSPQTVHQAHMTPVSPQITSSLQGSQCDTMEPSQGSHPATSPMILHRQSLHPVYSSPPQPPPGLPVPDMIAAVNDLQSSRWARMETIFHSLRDQARHHEFPVASVAALEGVLLRLYLEGPMAPQQGVGGATCVNGH